MNLSTITKELKESAAGQLGKWIADKWGIENQGVMDTFKVDTENKIFDITLKFKNQEQPTELKIRYSLDSVDGKEVLILTPLESSAEWIEKAVREGMLKNLFNRPIELPALAAGAMRHFL